MRVLLTTMSGERRTITLKHRHHIAKLVVRKLREADRLLDERPSIPAVYRGKDLRIDYNDPPHSATWHRPRSLSSGPSTSPDSQNWLTWAPFIGPR